MLYLLKRAKLTTIFKSITIIVSFVLLTSACESPPGEKRIEKELLNQHGSFSGTVLREDNSAELTGILVIIKITNIPDELSDKMEDYWEDYTNSYGEFSFDYLPTGYYINTYEGDQLFNQDGPYTFIYNVSINLSSEGSIEDDNYGSKTDIINDVSSNPDKTYLIAIKKTLPSVVTSSVSSITPTSAQCGGEITDNGGSSIISHGVCWNISGSPLITDNITNEGTGSGSFTSVITGLTPNTTYYIRAYATNSEGTGYGDVSTFNTLATNKWTRMAYFGGWGRDDAVGFVINNKGYIGTGYGYSWDYYENRRFRDFWEYNPVTDTWIEKTAFTDERSSAFGFSINNKGYVGGGYSYSKAFQESTIHDDFWEYDPYLNKWTKKSNFVEPVHNASGFTIENTGYVLIPSGNLWKYNPTSDTWSGRKKFLANIGYKPAVVAVGSKAYVLTEYNDFWEYDPGQDNWTRKSDFPGSARNDAVAFSVDGKAYIGTGYGNQRWYNDFWMYDPVHDSWTQTLDYPVSKVSGAVAFTISDKGYVGTGYDPDANYYFLTNFYEFTK